MSETKPASPVSVPTWVLDRRPDTAADDWRPVNQGWAHKTAVIGKRVTIACGAVIDQRAVIGDGAVVGVKTVIGNKVTLGNGVAIGTKTIIGGWTEVGNKVRIGDGVTLGSWVMVDSWTVIGDKATIGNRAQIGRDARVGDGVTVVDAVAINNGAKVDNDTVWNVSPLCVVGSRHPVYAAAPDQIGIGCIVLPVATWRSDVDQIGRTHRYSPAAIAEYRRHVEYVADWLARNQDKIRYADATTAAEN